MKRFFRTVIKIKEKGKRVKEAVKEELEKEEQHGVVRELETRFVPINQWLGRLLVGDTSFTYDYIKPKHKEPEPEPSKGYDVNILYPKPTSGSNVMCKALPVISIVYNAEREVVGYLIRILQFDPQWNPGAMVLKLIKQCQNRHKSSHLPRYEEPWPQYKHMAGGQFPVYNMTYDKWLKCVSEAEGGARPSFDTLCEQMGQDDRADDPQSPKHPRQVCTLSRALQRLQDAGGITGDIKQYMGAEKGDVCWPKCTPSYRYMPNQMFWDSERYAGLLCQYFPKAMSSGLDILNSDTRALLESSHIIERNQIISKSVHGLDYRTYNILIYYRR